MVNVEQKEVLTPFPHDPNKFEINKWMAANGLPVPEIYETVESAQEAFNTGEKILARGYLIDKGIGKNGRQFCADELLIDVLPTEDVFFNCQATLDRLKRQGSDLLVDPDFRTYCEECGIDPADLELNYFLQTEIAEPEDSLRILTADLEATKITLELTDSDKKYTVWQAGNLTGVDSGFVDSIIDLHLNSRNKLAAASGFDRWHLEMVTELGAGGDIYIVQGRRIPLKEGDFKVINNIDDISILDELVGKNIQVVDRDDLGGNNGIDLGIEPKVLLIGRDQHVCEPLHPGNRYGQLQAILYCPPVYIANRMLNHNEYRLIALAGAKECPFYLCSYHSSTEVSEFIPLIKAYLTSPTR